MKKISLVLIMLVMLFAVSACGEESTPSPQVLVPEEPAPPMEPTPTPRRRTADSPCDAKFSGAYVVFMAECTPGDCSRSVEEWVDIFKDGSDKGVWGYLQLCIQDGWLPTLEEE